MPRKKLIFLKRDEEQQKLRRKDRRSKPWYLVFQSIAAEMNPWVCSFSTVESKSIWTKALLSISSSEEIQRWDEKQEGTQIYKVYTNIKNIRKNDLRFNFHVFGKWASETMSFVWTNMHLSIHAWSVSSRLARLLFLPNLLRVTRSSRINQDKVMNGEERASVVAKTWGRNIALRTVEETCPGLVL